MDLQNRPLVRGFRWYPFYTTRERDARPTEQADNIKIISRTSIRTASSRRCSGDRAGGHLSLSEQAAPRKARVPGVDSTYVGNLSAPARKCTTPARLSKARWNSRQSARPLDLGQRFFAVSHRPGRPLRATASSCATGTNYSHQDSDPVLGTNSQPIAVPQCSPLDGRLDRRTARTSVRSSSSVRQSDACAQGDACVNTDSAAPARHRGGCQQVRSRRERHQVRSWSPSAGWFDTNQRWSDTRRRDQRDLSVARRSALKET